MKARLWRSLLGQIAVRQASGVVNLSDVDGGPERSRALQFVSDGPISDENDMAVQTAARFEGRCPVRRQAVVSLQVGNSLPNLVDKLPRRTVCDGNPPQLTAPSAVLFHEVHHAIEPFDFLPTDPVRFSGFG